MPSHNGHEKIAAGLTEYMGLVLRGVHERGGRYEYGSAGWVWGGYATTMRMMDGLVKRGYLRKEREKKSRLTGSPGHEAIYVITPEGIAAAAQFRDAYKAKEDARWGLTPAIKKERATKAWQRSIREWWCSERPRWERQTMQDALQQIADGHNDPRTLAQETLDLMAQSVAQDSA